MLEANRATAIFFWRSVLEAELEADLENLKRSRLTIEPFCLGRVGANEEVEEHGEDNRDCKYRGQRSSLLWILFYPGLTSSVDEEGPFVSSKGGGGDLPDTESNWLHFMNCMLVLINNGK